MTLRHLAISLAALTAVPLAACGSSGSSTAQTAATPAAHTSRSAGAVTIDDFKFMPAAVTVKRGTRIVISNHDSTAHTATADDGHSFGTGDITPGKSASFTLSKAGRYAYHCSIHPFMHGTVVVK